MQKRPHEVCGAKTRHGTPCKNRAGFKTPHFGAGRCYLHGGLSPGGAPGNKNALKTGEYETIWLDVLPQEEQSLYSQIDTDKAKQLDDEIRLITIRERRMLQRIERLKEHDFTVVEQEKAVGHEKGKPTSLTTEKRLATLGQIQAIEEALTRVQEKKAKLLELKYKMDGGDGGKPDIKVYVNALKGATAGAWSDETSGTV